MGNLCATNSWAGFLSDEKQLLKLRAVHVPVTERDGAVPSSFAKGDTVDVSDLVIGPEVEVMRWRYSEKSRNARPSSTTRAAMTRDEDVDLPPWPKQRCFEVHHRFWRVALADHPECFAIMQMASNPDERTLNKLEEDMSASAAVSAYAHKFNIQQAAEHAHDPPPSIKVVTPVGFQIVDSNFPSMFAAGDAVILYVVPALQDVQKFIFNAADVYVDLPQALFHFVAISSGGRELAYDLQGVQDGHGDIYLVDPAILKVRGGGKDDSVPVCGPLIGGGSGALEYGHFQALHSRCTPLCKVFDPHRTVRLGRGFTCCGN